VKDRKVDVAGVQRSLDLGRAIDAGGSVALVMLIIATLVVRSQRRQVLGGSEGMIGQVGVVRSPLAPSGTIVVRGEYWNAVSETPVPSGSAVEVVGIDGLTLRVRPART
jgi:membrane-bound serine protease (ClpP class)